MLIHDISSRSNPRFKTFVRLLSGQGVRKSGLGFLSGPKQVKEVLKEFPERCEAILFTGADSLAVPEGIDGYRLSAELFRRIDVYGTKGPIVLVRFKPFLTWDSSEWPKGCTLFVPFQDPGNVGAVIRSAAAFGISRIVVLKEGAHPFHHKSLKVAGGAVFRIPIFAGPSIQDLGSELFTLITLSPEGMELEKFSFPETFGLLPGLEGSGIPQNLRQMPTLSIRMMRGVESLNAALATGIVMYMWMSKARNQSWEGFAQGKWRNTFSSDVRGTP
ncbi:MAG: RNA methyltransferase [Deltaproteobacteria bacterium]|nr:RNA methyltransferase [Deltaproteobacteria bacterium]